MKYFVLKPRSKQPTDEYAVASRMAMMNYAKHIRKVNPDLANDLTDWAVKESMLAKRVKIKES
jgi:hypothetical protein